MPADPVNFGKYVVLDRIGKGAFGVVFRCSDPDLDRVVAVKVLLAAELAEPELIERFSREARAAAKLSHPNIVSVFDAGVEAGKPFLVMEYVAGRSLDAMQDANQWDTMSVLQLVYYLADALCYSHNMGVLHRDVKPANVLIDDRGRPKLADFGLARLADDARWLSATGDLLGTPRYMSPEQALLPSEEVDARADIYSLGAVFYELLAGRPIVDGPTALATLKDLTDGTPVPLSKLRPDLPNEVIGVCERMISKERENRFASAQEVMDGIAQILNPQALEFSTIAAFTRFPRNSKPEKAASSSKEARADLISTRPVVELSDDDRLLPRKRISQLAWLVTAIVVALFGFWGINYVSNKRSANLSDNLKENLATIEKQDIETMIELQRRSSSLVQSRDDAQYHTQLNEIRDELNSAIRRSPNSHKLRLMRAAQLARNGDFQMAIADWESVESGQLDTESRRLLLQTRGLWELLYRSSVTEGALRPAVSQQLEKELEQLEQLTADDIEAKRAKVLAKWMKMVADSSTFEDPNAFDGIDLPKADPSIPDLQMWRALIAFQQANHSHYLMNECPEDQKETLRKQRDAWDQQAMQWIREGLEIDSHHLGLLFLRSIRWIDKIDWDSSDGVAWTDAERRHRGPFESSFQRYRMATARLGLETAFGRAVVLERLGRHERALDQLNEFVDRSKMPATVTAFWVWLQLNVSQDSDISSLSIAALLKATDRFKEAAEPEFGIYFVRSLCRAATGQWKEARQELLDGKKVCKIDNWDSIDSGFREWLFATEHSLAKFQDLTVETLWRLPIPAEVRVTMQEDLLESLAKSDSPLVVGLEPQEITDMVSIGHFRLAKMAAERDDRGGVLTHLRSCLEQDSEAITVSRLLDDETIRAWNNDAEFQELYAMHKSEEGTD